MPEKLTIQDIARLAGVSKATVSRVINHKASVDSELSDRVKRIVDEKSFVPDTTAILLAAGRSKPRVHSQLIAVLAPPLTSPVIRDIIHGVATCIERTPYEIVLYTISDERNHSAQIKHLMEMQMLAGLLTILPGALQEHLSYYFQQGLPLVVIDDKMHLTYLNSPLHTPQQPFFEMGRHAVELLVTLIDQREEISLRISLPEEKARRPAERRTGS